MKGSQPLAENWERPTLLSSCARATTAQEARFRVQYSNSTSRTTRIFALDAGAAETMYELTEIPWKDARFLTLGNTDPIDPDSTPASGLSLSDSQGKPADLETELQDADVVILLASEGRSENAAEVIARECFHRNIMCAGLALAEGKSDAAVVRVVNSMRPFARVLVVAKDGDYVAEMLSALRA